MAQAAGSDSANRWRDKYLNLIDEQEKLKRSSAQDLDQYRRGLVMVSLLAEGQSSSIDTPLASLREAIKPGAEGNNSGMSNAMDELERAVQRFEAQNTAQAEVLLGQLSDAAAKLLQCPLPRPLLKRIKQVRRQAKTELQSWSGYIEQLQSWMQILGELATLEGHEEEQKTKWWQRWFKPTPEEPEVGSEVSLENPEAQPDKEPGFSHIAQEVSDTLINLLSQLVIPDRLADIATGLQTRLGKGLNWYELVPLLEDTAEFLIDCLGSGQQEFERFLQNLDQRLQVIQVLVTDANTGQAEREQARKDLDTLVRDQIADIRSVVTGSGDLGELGSSVSDHLTLIVRAMEKYQTEERGREQRLAEKLDLLQTRLNEMEQEASKARQIIEEQKRRATHDGLTGLPNRDAYQQRLEEELSRKARYGGPLTMVVADVDFFKCINDNYGHLAGDKVLQLLAKAMRKSLRDVDFIGRYGGEEFVILMPETNAEEALVATEKLRTKVESSPFNFRKERVPITMSFGISEFQTLEDGETVFERADKALYQAKAEGRNRCIVS